MNGMKLGVVLLAAGKSSRFGENKLLADFDGRPMVCCALDAIRPLFAQRIAVVTGHEAIAQLAQTYGYGIIENPAPQLGQAHSVRLGVSAMQDMDAVLLMVCDQPLLSAASLLLLISSFVRSGKGIACLCDQTHMGNPAVFAAKYFPELLKLEGDRGAKGILRANQEDLLVVTAIGSHELSDADTPRMLEEIKMR